MFANSASFVSPIPRARPRPEVHAPAPPRDARDLPWGGRRGRQQDGSEDRRLIAKVDPTAVPDLAGDAMRAASVGPTPKGVMEAYGEFAEEELPDDASPYLMRL